MRVTIQHGRQPLDLDLADGQLLAHLRGPAALEDSAAAVRQALEQPFDFPPLRKAMIPDDHVTLVVDESLADPAGLLVPILDHVLSAGVAAENVTLLCANPSEGRQWVRDLPERYANLTVEDHDPTARPKLAYLATTHGGLRVYLNRALVDADQAVVLTERRFDPVLGRGGAEGDIFPGLADDATRAALSAKVPGDTPAGKLPAARKQAVEVTWLLGRPFFVQVIPSAGRGAAQIVAGTAEATEEGGRLLDASWRRGVPRRADTVLVSVSGDEHPTFADLAWAVHAASRVVKPDGRIIALCPGAPQPGPGAEILLHAEEPQPALAALEKAHKPGTVPAILWARAVCHAHVYLLSGLPSGTAEDLFASPVEDVGGVQRLLDSGGEVLVVEDAQRMLLVLE